MATVTIPQTTVQAGTTNFPSGAVGSYTRATITLDRTLAGGLDSLSSADSLTVTIQSSPDGTTWSGEAFATFPGGPITNPKTGVRETTSSFSVNGVSPTATRVRIVTVATAQVVVAGSITAS